MQLCCLESLIWDPYQFIYSLLWVSLATSQLIGLIHGASFPLINLLGRLRDQLHYNIEGECGSIEWYFMKHCYLLIAWNSVIISFHLKAPLVLIDTAFIY